MLLSFSVTKMGCFQIPRRHFNVFQLLCNLLFLGCSVLFIHFGIVLTQIHQTCETASAYVETSGEQLKSVHVCSAVLVTLYGVTLAVYAVFSFMINAACG